MQDELGCFHSFYESSSAHDAESPDELVSSDVKPPFGRVNDRLGPITNDYLHFIDCTQPAASLTKIPLTEESTFNARQVTVTFLVELLEPLMTLDILSFRCESGGMAKVALSTDSSADNINPDDINCSSLVDSLHKTCRVIA
jgi:hypothetical protein